MRSRPEWIATVFVLIAISSIDRKLIGVRKQHELPDAVTRHTMVPISYRERVLPHRIVIVDLLSVHLYLESRAVQTCKPGQLTFTTIKIKNNYNQGQTIKNILK